MSEFAGFGYQQVLHMAGKAGFEPTNDGVKVRCLTAWLLPKDSNSISHYLIMSTVIHRLNTTEQNEKTETSKKVL